MQRQRRNEIKNHVAGTYLARDRLAVVVNGTIDGTILLRLGLYLFSEFLALELYFNIDRGRKKVGGHVASRAEPLRLTASVWEGDGMCEHDGF